MEKMLEEQPNILLPKAKTKKSCARTMEEIQRTTEDLAAAQRREKLTVAERREKFTAAERRLKIAQKEVVAAAVEEKQEEIVVAEEKTESFSWVADLQKEFESYNYDQYYAKLRKKSIYKWPSHLVIASVNVWHHTPHAISFGPYHHGKEHLQPTEHRKEIALHRFLQRTGASLWSVVNSLGQLEQELRDNYDDIDAEVSSESFLKMMLLDGCLILELLHDHNYEHNRSRPDQHIFSIDGRMEITVIARDMLMLENQIPLLVLKELLQLELPGEIHMDVKLNELISKFFCLRDCPNEGPGLHILDIIRKCMLMDSAPEEERFMHATERSFTFSCSQWLHFTGEQMKVALLAIPLWFFRFLNRGIQVQGARNIRSAVRFHQAGVRFKNRGSLRGLKITFDQKTSVLALPFISIDDSTTAIFKNLMAYERMHPNLRNNMDVTSYVAFMDNLIDTAEDVSLLCSLGIVRNDTGSDQHAADIFNKLSDGIVDDFDDKLYKELQLYAASDWNYAMANLHRYYFKSPWSIPFVLAAFIFLGLTIIRTVLSWLALRQGK